MSDRRATIRSTFSDEATAEQIARAVRPDNTASMATTTDDSTIETRIERPTTGGLAATVEDYVVNLSVAETLVTDRQSDTYE